MPGRDWSTALPHPGRSSQPWGGAGEEPPCRSICVPSRAALTPGQGWGPSIPRTGAMGHCWEHPHGSCPAPTPLLAPGRAAADVTPSVPWPCPLAAAQGNQRNGEESPWSWEWSVRQAMAQGECQGFQCEIQTWGCPPFWGETPKLPNMHPRLQSQPGWALRSLGAGASPGCSVLVFRDRQT